MIPGIRRITDKTCPECQAKAISSRVEAQHTNGEWNEYVTYECDAVLHWSPNFMSIVKEKLCKKKETKIETIVLEVEVDLCLPTDRNIEEVIFEFPSYGWDLKFAERNRHRPEVKRVRSIKKKKKK